MARIWIALLTFALAAAPVSAQLRKPIQAQPGDLILVDGNAAVRIVRRNEAQIRAIHNPEKRTLVIIADYAVDGAQPDGRVDVILTFNDIDGEWPLGERWDGRATLDEYSFASGPSDVGFGLTTPTGLIQALSGPASARDAGLFRDAAAIATVRFMGSGRRGGTRDSFDQAEARPAPGAPPRAGSAPVTPVKIVDVPAILPVQALQAGVRGQVLVEIHIAADGTVTDAKVLRSVPLLDEAALAAVRQWRYKPTLVSGTAVPIITTATVTFQ
jgi:TonB family protein